MPDGAEEHRLSQVRVSQQWPYCCFGSGNSFHGRGDPVLRIIRSNILLPVPSYGLQIFSLKPNR